MKQTVKIIGFFAFFGLFCWLSFSLGEHRGRLKGYREGYDYIKSVKELQEQVGARPDGIWGPETDTLYDKAYCDQCAEVYMTETGAPTRTAVEGILKDRKDSAGVF